MSGWSDWRIIFSLKTFVGLIKGIPRSCWDALWRRYEKKLKARPERLRWVMRQFSRFPMLKAKILKMDPAKRQPHLARKESDLDENSTSAGKIDINGLAPTVRRAYLYLISQK